jgi:hypothetical protein
VDVAFLKKEKKASGTYFRIAFLLLPVIYGFASYNQTKTKRQRFI